jgi:2-keto-4-pentenoate hydratase/2-oxohepta-3-ene-1,7-dioic acid hydratase in catechol pathway
MIFTVAELTAFASRFMTLEPGDIIATGTPSGTGTAAGIYLKAGDVMVGRIDRLGELRTPVVGPDVVTGGARQVWPNAALSGPDHAAR